MSQTIDRDDARLTAFALGEAEDPALEAALAADETLRAELEAIRATAGLLAASFREEPAIALSPAQRRTVLGPEGGAGGAPATAAATAAGPAGSGTVIHPPRRFWRRHPLGAAAASMAALLALAFGLSVGGGALDRSPLMSPPETDLLASGPAAAPRAGALFPSPAEAGGGGPAAAAATSSSEGVARGEMPSLGEPAMEGEGANAPGIGLGPGAPAGASSAARLGNELPHLPYRFPPAYPNAEDYAPITDNPFQAVPEAPLSTFAIDVDTASYANLRRFLQDGQLPPPDAVRIEELVNYFQYRYPGPSGDAPFGASIAVARAPWAPEHRLVRIGLKGREVPMSERPASNLVFLVDVSGSMDEPNKLPLVKEALRGLVTQLDGRDRVAIVTYAGESGLALPPTRGDDKWTLLAAIDRLSPGGGTNGAGGIQLAYDQASRGFLRGGSNRVILATDGDFNVGITDQGSLTRLIADEAKRGVFLSVLGFGTGNLKDSTMELLADKGNGHYAYIDSAAEARKVLGEQLAGTLLTIAKDVKAQVEFNPARVSAYRLIGYENRLLAAEDFNDDSKDAGEIGSGHTVTALYEVVPVGVDLGSPGVDPLRYQPPAPAAPPADHGDELLTLKLRYKEPTGETSRLLSFPVRDGDGAIEGGPGDFQLAAALAAFGMLLRDSPYRGSASFDMVRRLATRGLLAVDDRETADGAARSELLGLVDLAQRLKGGE